MLRNALGVLEGGGGMHSCTEVKRETEMADRSDPIKSGESATELRSGSELL